MLRFAIIIDILHVILFDDNDLYMKITKLQMSRGSTAITEHQPVNDEVSHSKNPKKCAYHVTFDLDLDLQHTLDAC